jgi:hypothetical protein
MDCPICRDLERAFAATQGEYVEARLSACYRVCRKFAARMNVDMERAKYELEEHRCVCVSEPMQIRGSGKPPRYGFGNMAEVGTAR